MAVVTIRQLEASLVQIITAALGWAPEEERTRIAWQGQEAPFIPGPWDSCFIRVTPVEDMTAQYRDTTYSGDYTARVTGQRVMQCACIFYGENAYDNAATLREWLFSPLSVPVLRAAGMEMLARLSEIQRVPELINEYWWERADFSFRFNTEAGGEEEVQYFDQPGEITVKVNR